MREISGTKGYDTHATALADRYESTSFDEVHRAVLHLFPATPARIVDIGAGTGRDAAALAARGHHVVAVEPTAGLRAEGERRHAGADITWIDDGLPELTVVRQRGERFDLVLLSAVWMHLDEAERRSAMANLKALLAPRGRVILSLRHGPVPPGRRMFDVSAAETIALGAAHGLDCIYDRKRPAVLSGPEVTWSVVALESSARS